MTESKSSAYIKINPHDSPNFYVDVDENEKPGDLDDIVADEMLKWMIREGLDYTNLEWSTELCEVEWSESRGLRNDYDIDIKLPEKPEEKEWCSKEEKINKQSWIEE
jgi:hypothetical protein